MNSLLSPLNWHMIHWHSCKSDGRRWEWRRWALITRTEQRWDSLTPSSLEDVGGGKPHMSTVERSCCLLSDWSQQSVVGKGAQTTGMTTAGLTHPDFKLNWRVFKRDIKEANLTFIDIACFACNLYELVPSFSLNTTWLCPASLCLSEHNPAGTRPAPTLSLARRAGQVHDGGHRERRGGSWRRKSRWAERKLPLHWWFGFKVSHVQQKTAFCRENRRRKMRRLCSRSLMK